MARNKHRRSKGNPSPNPTGNYGPESIMDIIRNNEEDDTNYGVVDEPDDVASNATSDAIPDAESAGDIGDSDDIDPSGILDLLDQITTSQGSSESESSDIEDTADITRASSPDSDILSKQNIDAKDFVSYLESIGDAEDAYDLFNYITQTVMASDENSEIRKQYDRIMNTMTLEERKQLHDIKMKAETAKRNRKRAASTEAAKGKGKGYDHWDTDTYYDMYGNMHLGARGPNGENNLDKRVMYEDVLSPVLSEFAHTTGKTIGDSLSLEGAKYDNYRSILGNAMGAMSDSYKRQADGISENRNRAADPRDYMNALSRQTDIASAALQANALEKAISKKKGAAAAYNIGQGIDNALRTTTANMRARDDAARQAQLMMNEHPNNGFYEDNISQRKRRDMASRPRSDK